MSQIKRYTTPELEAMEICIEQGFAASDGQQTPDYGEDGEIILRSYLWAEDEK